MSRKSRRDEQKPLEEIELTGYGQLPLSFHNALVLGVSIAATMEGAHLRCQRRDCRNFGRCRASPTTGRASYCQVPLGPEAAPRVEGMMMFALQLANGWR